MFKKKKNFLSFPVKADHREYSMIMSSHDDISKATPSLIHTSLQAIDKARKIDFINLSKRINLSNDFLNIWPGEHYKLLSGFVSYLNPSIVIEIGTATGLSALALKHSLSKEGKIITFDLFSWKNDPETVLQQKDFEDNRLLQFVENLEETSIFNKHKKTLEEASLIFIDATHDGNLETLLLKKIQTLNFKNPCYIIFDDIRVWTMLKMWREINLPKLDLTSFGHWSGTGVVETCQTKKAF